MSQVTDFDVPGSPLTMSALATALEAVFAALGSINRGAAAPSNPFEGMLWWDSAATVEILKRHTVTAGWVSILSVNRSTGAFTIIGATATPTASTLALFDADTRLSSGAAPSSNAHVVRKLELDTHTALTDGHSATSAATASRIALRDASANIKIGTAAADTDALNRITADGRFTALYTSGSQVAGGSFTAGTVYYSKIANIVVISWTGLTISSSSLYRTTAAVPAAYRPTDDTKQAVTASGPGYVQHTSIATTGVIQLRKFDWTGTGLATLLFEDGSLVFIIA